MGKIIKNQSNFISGELTPRMWGRTDLQEYASGAAGITNFLVTPFGSLARRPGFRYIATAPDTATVVRLEPFIYSNIQTYMLEFSDELMRVYTDQGLIEYDDAPYSITTPYAGADVNDLRFAQEFDTAYIVHPNYPPYQLVRNSDTDWVLSEITFDEPPYLDVNETSTTLTPSDVTGSVTITASADLFASTDVGRAIRLQSGPNNDAQVNYPGTGAQTYFAIPFYPNGPNDVQVFLVDDTGYYNSLTLVDSDPSSGQFSVSNGLVETGDTASTSELVSIQQANAGSGIWGWCTITAYTSATEVTATVNVSWYGTNATLNWRLGAFCETTGYPGLACFFEQRLWLANSPSLPNYLYGSETAGFLNFAPDDDSLGTISGITSVNFVIDTPSIQFIAGTRILAIGCIDGFTEMEGTSGPITAATVYTRKDSIVPAAYAKCTTNSTDFQFIELLGQKIHAAYYQFQVGGYMTEDITVLGEHIGQESPILQIAYAPSPSKLIWTLRTDGTLCSLTYDRILNLKGWAEHVIGGTDPFVSSIAVIPGTTYYELWAVISRTIGDSTVVTIECLAPEFSDYATQANAFYVDSGQTYNGSATNVISGLSRLNGETVQVCADGGAHPDCVVSDGEITLNADYSIVSVGFNSPAIFQSLNIEGGGQFGSNQTQLAATFEAGIQFLNTLGCSVGTSTSDVVPIVFTTNLQYFDQIPTMFTGNYTIKFNGGYADQYNIVVIQPEPLPITLLNVVYKAKVSDFI